VREKGLRRATKGREERIRKFGGQSWDGVKKRHRVTLMAEWKGWQGDSMKGCRGEENLVQTKNLEVPEKRMPQKGVERLVRERIAVMETKR